MARNFASMKINYHIYTPHVRFRDTTIKSTWILSFVHPRFEPPSTFEMYFNIFHPHPSCHMPISKGGSSFYTRYCADPWRISIFRFETEKYSVNVTRSNSTSIRASLFKNLIFRYIYKNICVSFYLSWQLRINYFILFNENKINRIW